MRWILLIIILQSILLSCNPKTRLVVDDSTRSTSLPKPADISNVEPDQATPKRGVLRRADSLRLILQTDSILSQHFTGLHIYDIKDQEEVFAHHADLYFTPASNVKLLTLLTALDILGHEIPTLSYCKEGKDIVIRGTGDPSFMTYENDGHKVIQQLQKTKGRIYIDDSHFMDRRYGSGWAWDDYPYYYQKEISPLPIYGNGLLVEVTKANNKISTYPEHLKPLITTDTTARYRLRRLEESNKILYNPNKNKRKKLNADIPLRMDDALILSLWKRTLGKPVYAYPEEKKCQSYTNMGVHSTDTLYKRMILDSDNFVADQLLLASSHALFDTMDTRRIIRHVQNHQLADVPDTMRWVDGSGLSRYNLITPRSLTWILEKIFVQTSISFIKEIFPSRMSKGTLLKEFDIPNVYAKTGSLSNNYNLSGYIQAKSGRIYAFSMMNNHFFTPTHAVDQSVQNVLKYIYRRY